MLLSPTDTQLTGNVFLIDPVNDDRWNKFVEEHPFGWIFHLSEWKQILEKTFSHIKGYYIVDLDDSIHNILSALPLFSVKSNFLGNRLVSIPFATLCDPLVSDNQAFKRLLQSAIIIYRDVKCDYLEIKSCAATPYIFDDRTTRKDHFINHYIEIDSSPEKLVKTFHRSCVRQKINRARNSDLKIVNGSNEKDLREFFKVYIKTRKRIARPVQPFRYFLAIWRAFSRTDRLTLLLAKKGSQTIGAVILLKYKDRVCAEFAASDEDFLHLSPNHLLFWESIKLAYDEGYRLFDFGRTHISNLNLRNFKKRWGTKEKPLATFYYPASTEVKAHQNENSWKFKATSMICKVGPPIFNQVVGNFFYGHMG